MAQHPEPPGGGYPQTPPPGGGYYQAPRQARPTNTLAIVSLVTSFFFAPAGLICGIIARRQIRDTGEQGDGLALAGIIISAVQIVIGVLALIFMILVFAGFLAVGSQIPDYLPSPEPFPTS